MTEIGFELLKRKVFEKRGFDFSNYKEGTIKRKIEVRLRKNNLTTLKEYADFLEQNPQEFEELFEAILINVSSFFRDEDVFKTLKQKILPEILLKKKKQKTQLIKIWSAGCASGEEPYSVAILLHELLGKQVSNWFIEIIGTDIEKNALLRAESAEFSQEQLKNVDRFWILKYFKNEEGKYFLKEEIVKMVKFQFQDLITDPPQKNLDLVLCRNVLIFFQRSAQEKVLTKIYECLNKDAFLVLGKTESLPQTLKQKFELIDLTERIYKKK